MREDLERTQSVNNFDMYQNNQQGYYSSGHQDNYSNNYQDNGYNGYQPQNSGGSNKAIIIVIIIATVITNICKFVFIFIIKISNNYAIV